jgi:3-hydroxyacyl-CoA dehydrogenase / enoyl-CoA hydratase / 3-hydroxybutyryl-CoA epimerase
MNIHLSFGGDGVAVLTFDRAGSSANVFDEATLLELEERIAALEPRRDLKGVVLLSAKPRIFIAGADLNSFAQDFTPEALGRIVDHGHRIFTRLERLPFPSVAAINGVCLGGGCELALACDWRVAALDKSVKIGLPETQLGILPAWGGSVRLPRLIGLPAALGLILPGKQLVAQQALKAGVVDEVAHPEYLEAAARVLLKRGKRPASAPKGLLNWAVLRPLVTAKARRDVLAKTRGYYPAPLKALEVCTAAIGGPLEAGLALERAAFLELVRTPECRNLMGIFFLQERSKKMKPPAGAEARPVRQVAVIGAGVMGAGIAQWASARGHGVLLKDVAPAALAKGLKAAEKIYRDAAKRRVFTEAEATAGFDRIRPVAADVPLGGVDLVIEAALEKLDVKQRIFQQLERQAGPHTVLATNTSALSIDAIAGGLADPGRVVGIHFFNPVHRMQLVEIVQGPRTAPATVATALQFVKNIGKLPVLVKDSPGFLVNRVLLPYMVESVRLFWEGCPVERIDRLMLDFGMPMGPLRLTDEVGLDVAQHVAADLQARLAKPVPINDTLVRLMEKGWLGKKSSRGFYAFAGRKETVNPELGFVQTRGAAPGQDDATLRDRMVLVMVNEAARCLEEGVVAAPEDVDFGMIFGTGWAPFRGGPLRYADARGVAEITAQLDRLAREVAPHFAPCDKLRAMAAASARFYPQ